jgi:hypothetical protein
MAPAGSHASVRKRVDAPSPTSTVIEQANKEDIRSGVHGRRAQAESGLVRRSHSHLRRSATMNKFHTTCFFFWNRSTDKHKFQQARIGRRTQLSFTGVTKSSLFSTSSKRLDSFSSTAESRSIQHDKQANN